MKTSTSIRLAAAGLIGLASMAQAQSVCAIGCFQSVITDHPPLDCKEENMYLCFCKTSNLQNWFAECIYEDCGDKAEEAVAFGVNLCADYGITITPPPRPEAEPSSTKAETKPTSTKAEEPKATEAEETEAEETQAQETEAQETEAEETTPAEETKPTSAAAEETSAETDKAEAPKPTTVISKPSHVDNTTVVTSTNPPTIVNMGASNAASGVLAVAGLAVAAFQLL